MNKTLTQENNMKIEIKDDNSSDHSKKSKDTKAEEARQKEKEK